MLTKVCSQKPKVPLGKPAGFSKIPSAYEGSFGFMRLEAIRLSGCQFYFVVEALDRTG